MDSQFENLRFWGDAAVWVLARLQHSSLVQNIQICMMGACAECARPVPLFVCDADVHVVALCIRIYYLHLPAHVMLYMSAWSCIFVCLIECVYSVIARGYKKLGPLCGSRGALWMNAWRRPKITNPLNNPDRPRRKACANISWSACLWLTYFAGVLKSGRQLLCPRETKREIIGTSGQPGVCKIKNTHRFYDQLHQNPTDVERCEQ